jgi:hypothetical protein
VVFGPPVIPPKPFSIADALKKAHADHMAREDAGYESEDERDVDNAPVMPSPSPTSPLLPPSQQALRCEDASYESEGRTPVKSPSLLVLPLPPKSQVQTPSIVPSPAFSLPKPRLPAEKRSRPRHRNTAHVKAGNKARQQQKREREGDPSGIKAVATKHLHQAQPPIRTAFNAKEEALTTGPGWVAKNQQFAKETYSLERLTGPEFAMELVCWDGV